MVHYRNILFIGLSFLLSFSASSMNQDKKQTPNTSQTMHTDAKTKTRLVENIKKLVSADNKDTDEHNKYSPSAIIGSMCRYLARGGRQQHNSCDSTEPEALELDEIEFERVAHDEDERDEEVHDDKDDLTKDPSLSST